MRKSKGNRIAYFIDFSIQEIPSIAYIAYEAGGIVYTDSQVTSSFIKLQYPNLSVIYGKTIPEIRTRMMESGVRVIVYPDYHIRYFRDMPGVKHVQVFHGTSDKKYDYSRAVTEYDLFFIAGEAAYRRYESRGLLKKGNGILIGYPKLDRVFKGELQRDEELLKLGLDPGKKTVMYAPTWVDRAYNSSWKRFRKAVSTDIPNGLNLIIKLHPNITRYRTRDVEEFAGNLKTSANARLFDVIPDPVPLFAASDILIGDVSAVTREFLAFKKPFVFLSSKPKWLWNRRKTVLWECGEIVRRPKELWKSVKRTLSRPARFAPAINKHFELTFYKPDGNAAARARNAIEELLS